MIVLKYSLVIFLLLIFIGIFLSNISDVFKPAFFIVLLTITIVRFNYIAAFIAYYVKTDIAMILGLAFVTLFLIVYSAKKYKTFHSTM